MKKMIVAIMIFMLSVPAISTNEVIDHSSIEKNDGNILYVGGNGEGNYTRIQDAINDASDGDKIIVYPGVYNERIEVNKSLCITGKKDEKDGELPVIIYNGEIVVNISAKNCTLKYFRIINLFPNNMTSHTLNILSDGNVIEGNVIEGGFIGISLFYSSRNIIKNNVVKKTGEEAISLDHSNHNTVESNRIIYNEWDGITLFASSNNIITKNEVKWNECGITILAYSSNNEISCNNASENTNYGITVQGASNNKIIGNHVYRNKEWCGISIAASSNTISENMIVANNWAGMDIEGRKNIISKNVIKNSRIGLFLEGFGRECRKNMIVGNDFIGNERHAGFWFEEYLPPSNLFFHNYWEGWRAPLPKPIFGTWSIVIPFHGDVDIPWFLFDFMPSPEPHKN